MADIEIKGLTVGERLLIARRRRMLTQEAMAAIYRTNRNVYGAIERDQAAIPENLDIPVPEIHTLTKLEICFLQRRRAGKTQLDVSADLGISRHWVGMKERGEAPNSDLIDHWND